MEQRFYDFKQFQFYGQGWGFKYVHQSSSCIKSNKGEFNGIPLWLEIIKWIASFISDLSNIPIPLLGM